MSFTVLSWNILAPPGVLAELRSRRAPRVLSPLVIENKYLQEELDLNGNEVLRVQTIIQILKDINADIMLLQEIDLATFELDFAPLLKEYQYERHKINKKRTNLFGNVTLWKIGKLINSTLSSRCLHITLQLENGFEFIVTNVHFPAKNGLDGYKEKYTHLLSCVKIWKDFPNVIFGGDFNDSLCFKNEIGNIIGLGLDIPNLGFSISTQELEKKTCKNMINGNIYNLDHILIRGNLKINYLDSKIVLNQILPGMERSSVELDGNEVLRVPNSINPSDHIPVVYQVTIEMMK